MAGAAELDGVHEGGLVRGRGGGLGGPGVVVGVVGREGRLIGLVRGRGGEMGGPGVVVGVVGRKGRLGGVSGSIGVRRIVGVCDGWEGPLDLTMGTTRHRVGGARCRIHGCSEEERR